MASTKKRKVDAESRTFQEKWTDNYFFIMQKEKPLCLICLETISVLKVYNLKRHYNTKHANYNSYKDKLRTDKIQNLKKCVSAQEMLFRKHTDVADNIVRASFIVSEKIAKHSKPYSEGEFVKECLTAVTKVLCPEKSHEMEKISLSRWTITRRIDEMASDIKLSIKNIASKFEAFSIALDESTDSNDTAQLAIFIRGVDASFNCTEELLALQPMKNTTRGEDIFQEVKTVFTVFDLKWEKLCRISTDGAPSMIGPNIGVVVQIKTELSSNKINTEDLSVLHCIIHQQNLCAKSVKFAHVMGTITACINFIKSRALNHSQFQEFLADVLSDHEDLTFYCEVRWLSKGKMLKRFYDLRNEVSLFMDMKGKPIPELENKPWLCDLAFLVNLTTHLNELNAKLQSQGQMIHELYGHIKSFQNKLRLWESQLKEGNTYHFPTLVNHKDFDCESFANELNSLSREFNTRFCDFKNQEANLQIFSCPFDVDVELAPLSLQMELIELQENLVLKSKFNDIELLDFYKNYFPWDKFPKLTAFAEKNDSVWQHLQMRATFFKDELRKIQNQDENY
ncbi:general transcription factor II-I repeat domain-containing protein 2-like [Erpetoichthys calabaricus]|uniref:general transcription factor II-I repeat domain-containing protein 2-like n=1 Tax=Erpetoichthys calabaricus TaxID=27687 RepID=UPI0022340D93|nr:general transcription factor II-I repeat domain-containing protein 2-like [Erpetoichthys calabaricus]